MSETSTVSSSVDGETMMECDTEKESASIPSTSKKKEQKRRPKPRDGTVLKCGVCGDRALGYNFDAITCESCKAFFRRNASKNKSFSCSFDGNCKMDAHTRKFCSGCRLKKCLNIGMKKEWILDQSQLAKRRQKPREPESKDESQAESPGGPCEVTTNYVSDELSSPSSSSPGPSTFKIDISDDDYPRPLDPEILECLKLIEKTYSSIFDVPYDLVTGQKIEKAPQDANDLFNLTDAFIRRLIKFGKVLPEFKALPQEDQIHVLKGGIMEIFVLRSAMVFDRSVEKWNYADQQGKKQLDPRIIAKTLNEGMYTAHMKFVRQLHELVKSDRYVLLLMFVIELFSPDRPNLRHKEIITKSQEKYSNWLKSYLESVYPVSKAQILYPKILMKFTDVRNLAAESAKIASNLDVNKVEPLGVEVFNLK